MDRLLEGWSQREIATEFALSEYGVSQIVNSPAFLAELNRRRAELCGSR
jgi:hypothetical protein